MAENSRVDAPIARDVGVADTGGYHFYEEFIVGGLVGEEIFELPVFLRVGDDSFAGNRVAGHG